MGSSKKVTVGYRYYMGLHFGLCHGPVDSLSEVLVGDRQAWKGSAEASGAIPIYAPELFGGDEKEGGIAGTLDVMMGEATQGQNSYLVSKISASVPAFRGILSAVWRCGQVSANNPYVKPWAFKVQRILQGWAGGSAWYPAKAIIAAAGEGCDTLGLYGGGPVTYEVNWPVLTQGIDPDYVSVGGLYPDLLTIGPFPYDATIKAGDETGAGSASPDDYFVFNGVTFNPGAPLSTPVPGGTTVYNLPAGETLTVRVLNMLDPYTHAEMVFTAFGPFDNGGTGLVDMNPAHIVYQCLTDTSWGMGYPTSAIDNDSFVDAADALFIESFGLSMLWNKQETIENFIQIVLDHIGALLYVNPETGAFALKLIRSDYDRGTLPLYGPTTLISAEDYQRQAWGETINEVTVIYTSSCTGKDTPVTVQDMANIQIQGGVVSQVRNYPGIHKHSLAQRVALRDLQTVSTPLARIKLTATRAAWKVFPGDVFRLTWPEYGIDDVVYRALAVNRGTLQDGKIIIDAVEDVFGLPDNTYLVEQQSEWEDPSVAPAPAPYRKLIEAPYWDLARSLSAADLAYVDALSGYLETLAVRPSGVATNYSIYAKIGAAEYAEEGNGDFCPSATVVADLSKTTTAITLANGVDLDMVIAGGYAIIEDEYVLVSAIDADALTATISRGVLDTVPATHTAGVRIWFADGAVGFSTTEYADTEIVDVKLLPITGQGMLEITEAPADSLTFDQRQYRPYPPGKLRVNTGIYPEWIDGTADLSLTWAHRDRLSQTAYIVTQDESSIGPESTTTYTIRIYGEEDTLIRTYSSISGTSQTYVIADEAADSFITIPGGSGDTYWHYVLLLLHCNGTNASTTFTDSSTYPITVTAQANAQISTAQSKFGGASGYFDGTGDYLSLPAGSLWDWGTSDFTIEFNIRVVAYNANTSRIFQTGNGDVYTSVYITMGAAGQINVAASSNGTSFNLFSSNVGTFSTGTWHHFALVRHGNIYRSYLNGTETIIATVAGSLYYGAARGAVIGGQSSPNRSLNGYIDEFRITKGVARYNGSFTPPTTEHPNFGDYRPNGRLRVELESVRGGLVSYQKHNHIVLREGYGFNYGYYYGGQ